jgi:hypothetical protein
MGFFKRKADPISERARTLNQQIAALEAEIERLSEQQPQKNNGREKPPPREAPLPAGQPRLRSTALPQGHSGATLLVQSQKAPPPPSATEEPPLEDLNPFRMSSEPPSPPERSEQLGVRKEESPSVWQRIKNNFRSPPASNPKLLNYLAAGSIHGLRPLRYEKRVARNRFLLLVAALAIMLWGLLAVLL